MHRPEGRNRAGREERGGWREQIGCECFHSFLSARRPVRLLLRLIKKRFRMPFFSGECLGSCCSICDCVKEFHRGGEEDNEKAAN